MTLDGEDILTSPVEGLWSIATDWKDSWPAVWVHEGPKEIERAGDWTILRGKLETSAGAWRIADSYRPEGDVIKGTQRGFVPYDDAYINVPPGAIIEKTFYLQAYPVARKAYKLFGTDLYRRAAEKAGGVYASRHISMDEPYWGGTLDASCEDKEGAFAALQGFVALYELTKDRRYLTWAEHACDVILTYVVVWDIDMPAGRLRDHGFKTRGWTAVSVQNQHIDVFGVLITPDIYRLGQYLDNDELKKLAILMYRSCGRLIDPYGSQGEQPMHTNYAQDRRFIRRIETEGPSAVRGNYVEDWTVFWITAHFLNAAAQFKELGLPLTD